MLKVIVFLFIMMMNYVINNVVKKIKLNKPIFFRKYWYWFFI